MIFYVFLFGFTWLFLTIFISAIMSIIIVREYQKGDMNNDSQIIGNDKK